MIQALTNLSVETQNVLPVSSEISKMSYSKYLLFDFGPGQREYSREHTNTFSTQRFEIMGQKEVSSSKAPAIASEPTETITAVTSGTSSPVAVDTELRTFRKQHRWDPFLDNDKLETIDAAIETRDAEKNVGEGATILQEDSPYPEVRSSVPNEDWDVPVNTIRAWTIGAIMCTVVAACNVLLGLRRAPIAISATVVQLVSYPIGCCWAKIVPNKSICLFGWKIELNPGPFNVKEHTIITMMTAAGSSVSYAINILLAQELFYKQHFGWWFQIMLIMSTQAMGLGVAGISRRFLVWPSSMVWPATLVTTAVMHSLHDHGASDPATTNGWTIGRYRFFLIVALGTFGYEWIPEVFAEFLQLFTIPCWVAPKNVLINQLFGWQSGLGLLPISFDWNTIAGWLGSPLQTPLFAILNALAGLILMGVATAGLGWAGPEYFRYLPLSANQNFDNKAQPYNTSRILTPDFTFNETAYKAYSPILLGPAFSMSYGLSFATLTSVLLHVGLFYGGDLWRRARNSKSEEPDVHLKMMRKYKECPECWFFVVFVTSFASGAVAALLWETHLTWWAYIICILIGAFFFIPIGTIQAITNQQPGLNVITELVVGFMLPGRPIAMMLFKSWGYMLAANGLVYISDMKVGHYMKVPPRSMFAAQLFAVLWLSLVQVATYNFIRGNISGICAPDQPQGLTCPGARTFFNASVIWGVVGPARMFGWGEVYAWANWFWLIGLVCPLFQWLIARRYPRSWMRFVVFPAIFSAAGMIPPATLYYLLSWAVVGVIFNGLIRRRYFGWWSRYNYILSGALDIGTALCIVVIGLALGLGNVEFPRWWGNTAPYDTLDATDQAITKVFKEAQEPIGPSSW